MQRSQTSSTTPFYRICPTCNISEFFSVSANSVAGTIPVEIGTLTRLKALDFASTFTSGTLPTEIGLMSSLEFIGADLTLLTGPFPTEIGNLGATLQVLQVRGADMGGTSIPSELGRCTALGKSLIHW